MSRGTCENLVVFLGSDDSGILSQSTDQIGRADLDLVIHSLKILLPDNKFRFRVSHITQQTMSRDPSCPLLNLAVELRLLIYSYAILDSRHITIGTSELVGSCPDILHRQYGNHRSPYPGIPQNHEPVIDTTYRADLLSATNPAVIELSGENHAPLEAAYGNTQTAYHTLSLLNKQINNELKTHFSVPAKRQTSLFAQYPYGLHILHTTTPQLLRQSRSVHLAGTHIPRKYYPTYRARIGQHAAPDQPKLQGERIPDSSKHLEDLVRSCFGPDPRHKLEKLEMRIYYPGPDSYSTVWGDEESPIAVALRNIALGEVDIECFRGGHGTGMYLTVSPTVERKRVVSTVWRRLHEGRPGQPKCGNWIVDPSWPEWKVGYTIDGSERDKVTMVQR